MWHRKEFAGEGVSAGAWSLLNIPGWGRGCALRGDVFGRGKGSLQPTAMSSYATRSRARAGDVPLGWGSSCPPPGASLHGPFAAGPLQLPAAPCIWAWIWSSALGSVPLGPGSQGPCAQGQAWGSVGAPRCFRAQSSVCRPPFGLAGWEHTTVPCVRLFGVSREGKCYFFQPVLPGRAGRGAGCAKAGRDGQAHSPALFPATASPRG